jgi:cytidine deaminase
MDIAPALIDELTRCARSAAERAYAPYSRFAVGAAVLTTEGKIHSGANVENASYGLSICAERNAIFQAVADGARSIRALVVYTPTPKPTSPCGACRQVLMEFGASALVVCCSRSPGEERRYVASDLLPDAFGPDHL